MRHTLANILAAVSATIALVAGAQLLIGMLFFKAADFIDNTEDQS
jgi:hypothetical protein